MYLEKLNKVGKFFVLPRAHYAEVLQFATVLSKLKSQQLHISDYPTILSVTFHSQFYLYLAMYLSLTSHSQAYVSFHMFMLP